MAITFHPILFNTEMVRAILEGRKTKTRRLPKHQPECGEEIRMRKNKEGKLVAWFYCENPMLNPTIPSPWGGPEQEMPCQPGDVLWVRETWTSEAYKYYYRADFESDFLDPCETLSGAYPATCIGKDCNFCEEQPERICWHPSIHMPKRAARIFLLAKSVTCERIQCIDGAEAEAEGALIINNPLIREDKATYNKIGRESFARLWNSTLPPGKVDLVGWEQNPWVFVIKFERVDKPAKWEEYIK